MGGLSVKKPREDPRPALGFFVGKDGKVHPRCGGGDKKGAKKAPKR